MFCECGHDRTAHLDWGNTTHEERMAAVGYVDDEPTVAGAPGPQPGPKQDAPKPKKKGQWTFPS